jgi:hypothetical protein
MINANEARALVEQSAELMEKYIEDLGKVIEWEALLGKSFVFPSNTIGLQFRTIYEVDSEPYRTTELTPLQRLLQAKLKEFGYAMQLEKQEVKIGGGLGSMDDEVRKEMHDYIKISW